MTDRTEKPPRGAFLREKERKTWRRSLEQPAFYCMFRMLASVVATDNREVCVRQTRRRRWWLQADGGDERFDFPLKKTGERNDRVHFQRGGKKKLLDENTDDSPPIPVTEWLERRGRKDGGLVSGDGWKDAARPPAASDL